MSGCVRAPGLDEEETEPGGPFLTQVLTLSPRQGSLSQKWRTDSRTVSQCSSHDQPVTCRVAAHWRCPLALCRAPWIRDPVCSSTMQFANREARSD